MPSGPWGYPNFKYPHNPRGWWMVLEALLQISGAGPTVDAAAYAAKQGRTIRSDHWWAKEAYAILSGLFASVGSPLFYHEPDGTTLEDLWFGLSNPYSLWSVYDKWDQPGRPTLVGFYVDGLGTGKVLDYNGGAWFQPHPGPYYRALPLTGRVWVHQSFDLMSYCESYASSLGWTERGARPQP